MESEILRVEQVATTMSKLPPNLGFTSLIKIELHEVIEELLEDVTGTTHMVSYMEPTPPVSYLLRKPRSFDRDALSRLLRRRINHNTTFCEYLADQIAFCRFSPANNSLYQRPFLISVDVRVVKAVRFVLSSVYDPSSGASANVFMRLLEEQAHVESVDLDETCSVCFEKLSLSSSESHQNSIIQMPNCLHSFHQKCIFEWIGRHNSCPVCRRVPYEEEDDQD